MGEGAGSEAAVGSEGVPAGIGGARAGAPLALRAPVSSSALPEGLGAGCLGKRAAPEGEGAGGRLAASAQSQFPLAPRVV